MFGLPLGLGGKYNVILSVPMKPSRVIWNCSWANHICQ